MVGKICPLSRSSNDFYLSHSLTLEIVGISEKFAEEAKRNASRIEQTLKAISLSNQAERKRLASEHALLLSQCQFQGGGTSEGTQSIRTQLLDLAAKQKQLLQCFMKQKGQLSKVLQMIHVQNRKSPNAAQQTLSTTNSQSTTTALTIQNKNQTLGSSLNMSCKTATTSTPSEALQLRRNTSISTAFPNLSNHLLQPLTLPYPETMPQHQHNKQQSELPLSSKQHTLQTQASSHSQSTQANPEHTHSTSIQQTSLQTQMKVVQSGNKAPVSSNDLSHPVPLKTLTKHGLIQPGRDCVSCTILVSTGM